MLVDKLTTYESWNLEKPIIPSHSRLYHLEPIGIGTPYVESLTGYIARLAESHCIATGMLVLSKIAPLIKKGYVFEQSKDGGLDKIFANQTQSLNGTGTWTVSLIQILESLTLQDNLSFLTMLVWVEVIPQKGMLRPIRAWCPACYNDWRITEQVLYEPLIWSLNSVTVCSHHHQLLSTQCPHCHQTNRTLAWRSRPGYCSKCDGWLGLSTLTEHELKWQAWVTSNIEDLIAVAPRLASPPCKEKIAKKFSAYADALTKGNLATFARLLGKGRVVVGNWCQGKNMPQLYTLLQICHCLGVSLSSFLTEESSITNLDQLVAQHHSQLQPKRITRDRKKGKMCDSDDVRRVLKAALTTFPPPSLIEVAQSLGYKSSSSLFYHSSDLCHQVTARYTEYQKTERLEKIQSALKTILESQEYPPPALHEVAKRIDISVPALNRHCPELCKVIAARRDSYRKERQMKRVQELRQEVRQVALKLNAEGVEPTASRISVHLTKPGSILQKEVVSAVREVRRELGWGN